jgi:hypothetical protein
MLIWFICHLSIYRYIYMYIYLYIYMYVCIYIYITRIRLLCPLWMVRSCFGDVWNVLAWFLRHPCHKIPGSYMVMWKKPGCRKPNTRKLGLADAPLSRLKGNPLMSQRSKRVRISIIFTFPVYPLVNIHSYSKNCHLQWIYPAITWVIKCPHWTSPNH